MLACFYFIPYYLLFRLVIANSTPVLVFGMFVCKLCGRIWTQMLEDLEFLKENENIRQVF